MLFALYCILPAAGAESCPSGFECVTPRLEDPQLSCELYCRGKESVTVPHVNVLQDCDGAQPGNEVCCKCTPPAKCFDLDGGKRYYREGLCVLSGDGWSFTTQDSCNGSVLFECYCENGTYKDEAYICPAGCANRWACKPETSPPQVPVDCNDSDGGVDYYVGGFVSFKSPQTSRVYKVHDKCASVSKLVEYFCRADGKVDFMLYKCLGGCSQDACMLPVRCNMAGAMGGGWYWGKVKLKGGNCAGCVASCRFTGSEYEGWYSNCDGSEISLGLCNETRLCFAGSPCRAGEFCDLNSCSSRLGKCERPPLSCPQAALPVCGCDRNTYKNDCERQKNGASFLAQGACADVLPDLTPENLVWQPAIPTTQDWVTFEFAVKNAGGVGSKPFKVAVFSDGRLILSQKINGLPANGNAQVQFSGTPVRFTPGSHKVKAVVDYAKAVLEYNETNNEVAANISVTPPTSNLNVTSNPDGAEVYIRSNYKGTTPILIKDISPGTCLVKLIKPGYKDVYLRITLNPWLTSYAQVTLIPAPTGNLEVISDPSQADILVDGQLRGTTPLTLEGLTVKMYTVKLSKDGYLTYAKRVMVEANSTTRVTGVLTPKTP